MKSGTRALGIAESYTGSARAPTPDETTTDFSGDTSRSSDSHADADIDAGADADDTDRTKSVFCGAVVRADGVVDGLEFETCTVGGDDATDTIAALYSSLGREDVRYVLVSGIAPAWFNLVDVSRLGAAFDRPVLSVSFEESDGLEAALSTHFSGEALDHRLETYRAAPPRHAVVVNGEQLFVRATGCDVAEATQVVRAFTPTGGRPEPIRVARLAARAARRFVGD
ncbi:hypothetical protein C440_07162 [Haloferax mucosum ATCC BAA-1512]|uniref:UPF0215 protein C440_07162 n=1 Tax=Haloferax mucosum ATCC BAA-1512 TaxID=662479 RepID=M0IDH7_9EURY|nr:DUF99 family protein [Haloferax mucosum]ELZ94835.1 hypothetical protein C440_07162 [Haloferax mucosum ATCC BAA-1512]